MRRQPGAPRRGGEPDGEDRSELDVQPVGGRPARPGHVRQEDQGADVHGLPVGGRADRAGTAPTSPSTSPARTASGSRSPTAPTSTRSIRTPTTGCTTSWSCTSPNRHRSSTPAVVKAAAPVVYDEAMGLPKTELVTLPADPDPGTADLRIGAVGVRSAAVRSACCSTTARGPRRLGSTTAGDPYPGFEAVVLEVPDPRHEGSHLVLRGGRHAR